MHRAYSGAASQHWHLENWGHYKITNVNSGKVLQIMPITYLLTQGTYAPASEQLQQKWYVSTFAGEGYSATIRAYGPYGLGVTNAGTSAGDIVELQSTNNPQNTPYNSALVHQRWIFHPLGNGAYKIQNENSGLVLDISGASTADGAAVIQWPWHGGTNQQWLVENVLPTLAPTLTSTASPERPLAKLTLYPSPATSHLYLAGIPTPVRVRVTDLRGSVISSIQYAEGRLDISRLAPGLYLVTASDGQHEYHQRFIKQ